MGDDSENTSTRFKNLLQNHLAISTKLGTKHTLVKEIQVSSNEEPNPFPREENSK